MNLKQIFLIIILFCNCHSPRVIDLTSCRDENFVANYADDIIKEKRPFIKIEKYDKKIKDEGESYSIFYSKKGIKYETRGGGNMLLKISKKNCEVLSFHIKN